jgi:arginine utilization protein RocB
MMELVGIQSDTGTHLEKDVERYLYNWLGELDYFASHPDHYGQYFLLEDPYGRAVVWGLVKGKSDQTVILMNHHDVVDAFDYGKLTQWAYRPQELQAELEKLDLSEEVRKDLESGDWIFGRGTSDMKAGLAIQLVLLDEFANQPDLKGNLLILSVPDEEALSAGMRDSLDLLIDLKEKFNLDYHMLIDAEPHFKDPDGKGIFYEGSAGKLLPVIYVRGKKTHVGQIFQGLNPVLLLSEIVRHTELDNTFSDVVQGEVSPPPSWLHLRDRKTLYDVSIPDSAAGYLNLISLTKTPRGLIQQLKETCETAFQNVIAKIQKSYEVYSQRSNQRDSIQPWKVNVKTFSELYQAALVNSGEMFLDDYIKTIETTKSDIRHQRLDAPEGTFLIIEKTLNYISDLSPMVIIALSPPYYPPVNNANFENLPESVVSLTDHLIQFSEDRWGEVYKKKNFMMGITDMSYTALQNAENVVPYIEANMPLWQQGYEIPFAAMEALSLPVINIGPWGKDCHKFTERVFKRDVFERTAAIMDQAIRYLWGEAKEA